jgi:hypothetical protein
MEIGINKSSECLFKIPPQNHLIRPPPNANEVIFYYLTNFLKCAFFRQLIRLLSLTNDFRITKSGNPLYRVPAQPFTLIVKGGRRETQR